MICFCVTEIISAATRMMSLQCFACARVLLCSAGCARTSFGAAAPFRSLHLTAAAHKGHSKWDNIKDVKGKNDAKRAALLSRFQRFIKVAVKSSGGFDMKLNPKLVALQEQFKGNSLPLETFERMLENLKNKPAQKYWLDVIGPSGSFLIVEIETDNRNSTMGKLEKYFKKSGSGKFRFSQDKNVRSWFESKGVVVISANRAGAEQGAALTLEQAEEIAIEVDCEDVSATVDEEGAPAFEIVCEANSVEKVEQRLTEMNLLVLRADTEFRAISSVHLDADSSACTQTLYELLESDEDVVKVFDNIDPGESVKSAAA